MTPKYDVEKLNAKVSRAITEAGLSWATCSSIVKIADKINGVQENFIAVWVYDTKTKEEYVVLHPNTVKSYNAKELAIIIRHELLHKAMFRGIRNAANPILVNIALDACINKILFLSGRKQMLAFSKKIYGDFSREVGPLAVCNCSITSKERELLPERLRNIFDELYYIENKNICSSEHEPTGRYDSGNDNVPDPLALYHNLSSALTSKEKEQVQQTYEKSGLAQPSNGNQDEDSDSDSEISEAEEKEESEQTEMGVDKSEDDQEKEEQEGSSNKDSNDKDTQDNNNAEADSQDGGEDTADDMSDVIIRGGDGNNRSQTKTSEIVENTVAEVIKEACYSKGCSDGIDNILNKYVINAESCATKELSSFVDSWYTLKQVEGAELCIYSNMASSVRYDPYPNNLTRTGIEMIALGVSNPDTMPLFLNSDQTSCRRKICAYIDLSGSMRGYLKYIAHIIEFFDNLDECEYCGGEFNGLHSFDSNVHGISPEAWEDLKKGIFYAGYCTSFDAVVSHALKEIDTNQVDVILVLTDGESNLKPELIEEFNQSGKVCYRIYLQDSRFERNGVVKSPLDMLNGESFTINVRGEE